MIKDDKKLNITMISDSFYPVLGGRESAVDNLCKELNKEHNLTLATGNISPKHKTIQDFDFGYAILRSKCLKFRKYEYLCFANKKFRKIIENNQIDIIHTQTKYGLCNYGIKLAKKKNIPVITTAHTNYPEVYKKSIKCGLIRHFAIKRVVKIINKMDAVITVSKHMAKVLEKIGCKTKIKVIPNGTDIIYPEKPQELINKVNDLYNLKNEENVFLVVGYVSEVKNV